MGGVGFPLAERVLGPHYLDGLYERPVGELRAMRAECEQAESSVSFARRVLQGRLDIVENELSRRRGGDAGQGDLHDLIERLPQILAHDFPNRSADAAPGARPVEVTPDLVSDDLVAAIDAVAGVAVMSSLPDLSDDAVSRLADRLRDLERDFSATRRELHQRIDTLKLELTGRYERGEVSVEGLLS